MIEGSPIGLAGRLASVLAMTAILFTAPSCDDDRPPATLPPVIETIVAGRDAPAADLFEVWVCVVPADTTDPLFAVTSERLALNANTVVERVADGVADGVAAYYVAISHDAYRPGFVAGGVVQIAATDTSQQCIDSALARSRRDADAVMVVANAQHAADQPGGRSTPGAWLSCTSPCAAAQTGRYVYVGANDFAAATSDGPGTLMPLDLIEHELGHSLGLPHSGDVVGAAGNKGVGPYDVMADPASPRETDPSRRDAPDMLAIDRLNLGWLPLSGVHLVDDVSDRVSLSPAAGTTGTRLLIAPIDDHRALTIELLLDSGYDDHLPGSGVVVHMIDDSPAQCGATTRCTGLQRVQQIVAVDGGDRTLLHAGDIVTTLGWTVSIDSIGVGEATVTVSH